MPLLTATQLDQGGLGRHVRLPGGLPDFNGLDWAFVIEEFAGFDGATSPDAVLVANGGGPGAFAVGEWMPSEAYYTLRGSIEMAGPSDVAPMRSALLGSLPTNREVAVLMLGGTWDIDKQVFVRRYDAPEIEWLDRYLNFTIPLVAPDPYKYALEPLTGEMGVFAGVDWFRSYTDGTGAGAGWYRTYDTDGARVYERQGDEGEFPLSIGLTSPGDATSRRVTVEAIGPLPMGWWVERQDSDGVVIERVWAQTALAAGQTVVLDASDRSATLNGSDVSHLVFGDFLTMPAGASTYRLVAPEDLGGHAAISGLPAYQ